MTIYTLYHNPKCGTSRNTLAFLREAGHEPVIVEYLKNTPTQETLWEIAKKLNAPVRNLLRSKESLYTELNLADEKWTDDELVNFIVAHPILFNRPVVVTDTLAKICRPSETVKEIL